MPNLDAPEMDLVDDLDAISAALNIVSDKVNEQDARDIVNGVESASDDAKGIALNEVTQAFKRTEFAHIFTYGITINLNNIAADIARNGDADRYL